MALPIRLVGRIWQLRSGSTFQHISVEALGDLPAEAEQLGFEPVERIWRVGDQADWFMLVVRGVVHRESDGGTSFHFGRGHVVGGLDSLAEQDRW